LFTFVVKSLNAKRTSNVIVVAMKYNYMRVKSDVFQKFRNLKHEYLIKNQLTNLSDSDFLKILIDTYIKQEKKNQP